MVSPLHLDWDERPSSSCNSDADNQGSSCSKFCFAIMISISFIISGILCTLYGCLLPYLYQLLNTNRGEDDTRDYQKYKIIFLVVGVSLIVFGTGLCMVFVCSVFVNTPRMSTANSNKRNERHSPHYPYSPMREQQYTS